MRSSMDASRQILAKAGTKNYVDDTRNLSLSLNHDHGIKYATAVLKRLQKAVDNAKGDPKRLKSEVEKTLSEIRDKLLLGEKYRYP